MTRDTSEDLILLIGQMHGKLDLILEQNRDHAVRIGRLERDRTRLAGVVAGLSAAVGLFWHDRLPSLAPALLHLIP